MSFIGILYRNQFIIGTPNQTFFSGMMSGQPGMGQMMSPQANQMNQMMGQMNLMGQQQQQPLPQNPNKNRGSLL